jgi:hypothetical protein
MALKELSDGGSEGSRLGQSASDLIGCYGATPAARPSGAGQAVVATATITALATTPATTDIATAVNSLITRVAANTALANQLRADLITLGLIKGSA